MTPTDENSTDVTTPEVGMKVQYWPSDYVAPLIAYSDKQKPLQGEITQVWHHRMVNLTVIDQKGNEFKATSIPLLQGNDPAPAVGTREYCQILKHAEPVETDSTVTIGAKVDPVDAIEAEIQAKGLTAPRVTPDDFNANILDTEIVKHVSKSGQVLRWAVLTTTNGFAVTGRPSASASPENDDASIGEKVAIDNARQELWPMMGYALRERLHGKEALRPYYRGDFPLGKACDLRGDQPCEACQ